jgi:hypothetical protein
MTHFFLSFFKQQTSSQHESFSLRAAAKPQVEQELNDDIKSQLRALKRQKR